MADIGDYVLGFTDTVVHFSNNLKVHVNTTLSKQ